MMNRKQFAMCGVIISAIIGAIVGYSVQIHNFVLPLIAVTAGILILHLLRRKVDEVIEDERIYRISDKASRRTLQVFGIGTALVGTTLISLGRYQEIGYALNISVCILLILYMIFYAFYSRSPLE
ncbi:MAG TPA: DUF2178 domain-containing protein [Thermoplasmatales archaeon]|nr:DUF2178 domain-containing protein [Thermoplasmatales archaeon]